MTEYFNFIFWFVNRFTNMLFYLQVYQGVSIGSFILGAFVILIVILSLLSIARGRSGGVE